MKSNSTIIHVLILIFFLSSCAPIERLSLVITGEFNNGKLYGEIVDLSDVEHSDHGFCYSQLPNPTITENCIRLGEAKRGSFYSSFSVEAGNWYVKAFLKEGSAYFYGDEINISVSIPTIATKDLEYKSMTSVTIAGIINAQGVDTYISFEYSTNLNYDSKIYANPEIVRGYENTLVTANIKGLNPGTIYNYRIKATSSAGTSYSNDMTFTTENFGDPLMDVDGNIYNTIKIGAQTWMTENLKTTKFNDGSEIPFIKNTTSPGYCWYNNDEAAYRNPFGAMYNFYAVNTGMLCPIGWHVPSELEWKTLINYLGGSEIAGGKIKDVGTKYWKSPISESTNETGFTALPGGFYNFFGARDMGSMCNFWSSTDDVGGAWSLYMINFLPRVSLINYYHTEGLSIRCLKD
jgi:uncharacterized protein (TIGR02145 family)